MTVPRREGNDFWRWSLRTYRLPGVEAALIALQEEAGTDTNLLLWCCWQASLGRALGKRELRRAMAATARWQAEVIVPLRRARRSLKASPQGLPEGWADDLRRRIAAAELDMEYVEQRALFELAQALAAPARKVAPKAAAQVSVAHYIALLGVVVTPAVARRVDAIIGTCVPPGDRPAQ